MIEVIKIEAFNPATSQIETLGFTSSEDYFFEGQIFLPLISEKFVYSEQLFDRGKTSGEASIGVGNIVVGNINGMLDRYKKYGFDGRKATIYRLQTKDELLSDDNIYFTGTIAYPDFGWDKVTWNLKSRMEVLNVPMQPKTFDGTNSGTGGDGGFEGSEGVKGRTKPQVFGRCMNVEGVPVNEFWLMYGFNFKRDGTRKPVYKFYNVYVKGIEYNFNADYSDAESLRTATIAAGYFATCVAEGLIRLGSVPASNGKVVANVADAPDSACSAAQVTQRILQDNAGFVSGTDYDADGLAVLDNFNPCPVGYYVEGTESIAAVIGTVLDSIGGWIVPNVKGVFNFGLIDLPDVLSGLGQVSVATITSDHWGDSIESVAVGDESHNIPAYSVKLAHTRNWAVQESGALADAVGLGARLFFTEEYRYEERSRDDVLTAHPLAPSLEFETVLLSQLYFSVYNWDFQLPISSADWTFIDGGKPVGTYTQTGGVITVTPNGIAAAGISQTVPCTSGMTELLFKLPAGETVNVVMVRNGLFQFYNEVFTAGTFDEDFIREIFIDPIWNTTNVTIYFYTVDEFTPFSLTNVRWRMKQQGKSPLNECVRRLTKESTFTERYTMELAQEFCKKNGIGPGRLITLQDPYRFDLQDGKKFLVIGVDQDGDELTTSLDIWG